MRFAGFFQHKKKAALQPPFQDHYAYLRASLVSQLHIHCIQTLSSFFQIEGYLGVIRDFVD